ncbi:MAG: hypothetical protein E7159_02970 [Firmicutes bacterium]|nr:hypothetical protein [Bacillota bacterium]
MNNKYFKPLVVIVAIAIVITISVSSYAYFTASVNSEANANVITTGNMEVTYEDGSVEGIAGNMLPGDFIEKKFSVTNTGNVYALYDIYLNDIVNTFDHTDELVCELISDNGANVAQRECPTVNGQFVINVGIDVGQTHNYTLKVTFLAKNHNQDYNQGAKFEFSVNLIKTYDTTRVLSKFLVTSQDKYDMNKSGNSLSDFISKTNRKVYLKQDAIAYYTNLKDVYVRHFRSENLPTLDECTQMYYEDCKEENGQYYYEYYDNDEKFYSLSECMSKNEDLFEEYGGDCAAVHVSDEGEDMIVGYQGLESEVCIYNNGDEFCFGKRPYYNRSEDEDYYDTYHTFGPITQAFNDEVNSYKPFTCSYEIYGLQRFGCLSADYEYITYGYEKVSVSEYTLSYYPYVIFDQDFDNYNRCMERKGFMGSLVTPQCYLENGVWKAHVKSFIPYDSMEICEEQRQLLNVGGASTTYCQTNDYYHEKFNFESCSVYSDGSGLCENGGMSW